jgi:hypothetical protein
MGAHNFQASAYARSAKAAYAALVAEALYDEGHNSYNGTISTTNGFKMSPRLNTESVEDWFDRATDEAEKRGPAICTEATEVEVNEDGHPLWHFAGWAAE